MFPGVHLLMGLGCWRPELRVHRPKLSRRTVLGGVRHLAHREPLSGVAAKGVRLLRGA